MTVDADETAATVQSTMTSRGLTFPVLIDAGNAVIGKYGVRGIPTTFFIDKTGVITDIRIGYITSMSQMESFLAKIVK